MQVSPTRYRQIAIGALVALSVIIVTGAAVRLTNSGLGCDDWPNCSSTRLIDVSSKHAAIEQINRLFTGVVGVAVIAAVLAAIWRVPRRSDLIWWSVGLVIGVVANAVLGGISVIVDLHPIAVQGHLLLSMMLISAATVLVRRSGEPDGVPLEHAVSRSARRLAWIVFTMTSIAIATGTVVTGAGPHAGDENAARFDIAIPDAARIHGVTVLTAVALALALAYRLRLDADDRAVLQSSLTRWIGIALFQGALGYVQYFNDVPELLVGIHVLGATLVMIATTLLVLDTRRPAAGAGGTVPVDGAPAQATAV